MADFQSVGTLTESPSYTTSPIAAGSYPAGTPVYKLANGQVAPARANALATSAVLGMLLEASQEGEPVDVQWGGSFKLTDLQWQQVLGTSSGGLTTGATYYLSDTVAGEITATPPTTVGHFVVQLGIAEFTTNFFMQLGPPQVAPL